MELKHELFRKFCEDYKQNFSGKSRRTNELFSRLACNQDNTKSPSGKGSCRCPPRVFHGHTQICSKSALCWMTSGPNSLSHLGSRANWSSERIKEKVGGEVGWGREGIEKRERGGGESSTLGNSEQPLFKHHPKIKCVQSMPSLCLSISISVC